MSSFLASVVVCVAGLLNEAPPVDAQGVVTPVVEHVSRTTLAQVPPAGYAQKRWAQRGFGLFIPPRDQARPSTARIMIVEASPTDTDIYLAHEIAHFVLWSNGRPWHHGEGTGPENVSARIGFVERKFSRWCDPRSEL